MKIFSINQHVTTKVIPSSNPTQYVDVLSLHSLDQKGNQQPRQTRKKGRNNKRGGNRKENSSDDKNGNYVGGDKNPK